MSLFAPNSGDDTDSGGVEMIENVFFTFPLLPFPWSKFPFLPITMYKSYSHSMRFPLGHYRPHRIPKYAEKNIYTVQRCTWLVYGLMQVYNDKQPEGIFPHGNRCHSHFHLRSFQLFSIPFHSQIGVLFPLPLNSNAIPIPTGIPIMMIYYASWQHKLKTYIHTYIIHKTKAGNDYKKRILTYTRNHTQNYKHSAKLLHTADLM